MSNILFLLFLFDIIILTDSNRATLDLEKQIIRKFRSMTFRLLSLKHVFNLNTTMIAILNELEEESLVVPFKKESLVVPFFS